MATKSKATSLESIFRLGHRDDLSQRQRTELYTAMSPMALIDSFYETLSSDRGKEFSYFRMKSLQETFLPLKGNSKLLEEVANIIIDHFKRELKVRPLWQDSGTELLPVLPILLECPVFDEPGTEWGRNTIDLMGFTLVRIKDEAQGNFDKLVSWWQRDADLLARVVRVFLQAFKSQNQKDGYVKINGSYLGILKTLYKTNKSLGFKIDVEHFYLGQVEDAETVRKLGEGLLRVHQMKLMCPPLRQASLLDFPFLLDVPTKWKVMALSFSHLQMTQLQHQQLISTFGTAGTGSPLQRPIRQVRLRFEIDADKSKTVESAISNIRCETEESLLLPLEVHFKDDVSLGVNAGGPMKEFFSRLFEQLEEHSIFRSLDGSSSLWFNKNYKDMDTLRSVGKLFALMFYNKVIISFPFPFLFYRKLMGKSKSRFEDLRQLEPTMAEGMKTLLKMSDDELSDFTFTVDGPDDESEIELKPGGKDEIVTSANVRDYLELYAQHYTAASHFDVFSESFRSVMRRFPQFQKFFITSQELMSLFQGGEYDWKSFQESFRYENGYTSSHSVVEMFWSDFHDLNEQQKRDFLRFMTGADHVPLGGFREIGPRIWPLGGDTDCRGKPPQNMCPEMNTCHGYVVLHLPMYSKIEHLKERLLKLLEMKGQGFHKLVTQ